MSKPEVVRIKCPQLSCQRVLAVPGNARGKLVRCRNCGTTIKIPEAKSSGGESKAPAA
ncbi:MAG: hypothetical protein KDA25_01530 [Phycisphaerales bacterium]|nr:hypothetical protein [Phycisphaerales bacterium]